MFSRKSITDQFQQASLQQLKSVLSLSIEPFDNTPIQEHYSIVAIPTSNLRDAISDLILRCKYMDTHQYYYPREQLHMTILASISIETSVSDIEGSLKVYLRSHSQTLSFLMKGIGSNIFCASISGYPNELELNRLRTHLRNSLGSGTDYSDPKHIRQLSLYEYVGWINFLRYRKKPKPQLIEFLVDQQDTIFGIFEPKELLVYRNRSKVLDSRLSECVLSITI